MSVAALLTDLAQAEITLTADGDKLRYQAPAGALTEERRQAIIRHRAELLTLLAQPSEEDIRWRHQAMCEQLSQWRGSGIPFLVARRDRPIQDGCCQSCGDPLPVSHKWRCPPCSAAATLAIAHADGGIKEVRP